MIMTMITATAMIESGNEWICCDDTLESVQCIG